MKGLRIKFLLILSLFAAFPFSAHGTALLPVGQPEYDFLYQRWLRQEAIVHNRFDYQLGPYSSLTNDFSYGPFSYLRDIPRNTLQLFGFAGEDARISKLVHPVGYESYRGGLAANPFDRFFVYGNFLLDEQKAKDQYYSGKKWRGLAGGVEQAFVSYQTKSFQLMFGRFASFWGPRESLVLAATNDLDGLAYSVHWGHLVFSYRLARLDGDNRLTDSGAVFENRYFAGHRLDFHLTDRLRLGIFETVIFAGAGRTLELNYLNPLLFFHSEQLNDNINDNTFLGFDFSYLPVDRVRLYGQLLVDDFQIEKKSQGDQEPNEYGLLIGGEFVDALPGTDLQLSYSKVTNRTFNQPLPRNRYEFHRTLIGDAEGNDYDLIKAGAIHWLSESSNLSLDLSWRRQGEGNVNDPWTTPWLDIQGSYREPFPTGTVEKTLAAGIGGKTFVAEHFYIQGEAGLEHYSNFGHLAGQKKNSAFVRLRFSTFFNLPVAVE